MNGHCRTRGRGFALPLVVLLVMVGAIMTAVMLERQAAQQLSVNRQLERYGVHHAGRGIKEVVGSWLNSVKSEPIENLLGKSGHALDVELKDGRVISVFLVEAQGTALNDTAGLDGAKAAAAAGIIERLRVAVGEEELSEYVRPAGPVAVSAITAPVEVLTAAAAGVLGESAAGTYAEFLIKERKDGKLLAGKVTAAVKEAGGSDEDRAKLVELVTDKPTLYRLTAEVRGRDDYQNGQVMVIGGTRVLDRYEGLVVLESKQGGRGSGTSPADLLNPLGLFLTWEHLPPKETPGDE